jgi:hypothetical protein
MDPLPNVTVKHHPPPFSLKWEKGGLGRDEGNACAWREPRLEAICIASIVLISHHFPSKFSQFLKGLLVSLFNVSTG